MTRHDPVHLAILPFALPGGERRRRGTGEVCRGFASFLQSRLRQLPETSVFVQHLIYSPRNKSERKGFVLRRSMWSLDEVLDLPRPEGAETTHLLQGRLEWGPAVDLTIEVVDLRAAYTAFQRRIECPPEQLLAELSVALGDIARCIQPTAPAAVFEQVSRRPTESVEAFRFWLRGLASLAGCQLEVPPYDAQATFEFLLEALRLDESFTEPCLAIDALAQLQLRTRHDLPSAVVAALEAASRRRPDFPGFHATLGQAHMDSGNLRAARRHLERFAASTVQSTDPPVASALVRLAAVRHALGEPDGAYSLLKEAATRFPSDTAVLESLGVCHLDHGHLAAAERCWRKVLEHDPRRPVALSNLAQLHARRGDRDRARILFERSIEDHDAPSVAWARAVEFLLDADDLDAADDAATRWVEHDADNWRAWLQAGRIRRLRNQPAAAEHCLRRAEALVGETDDAGEVERARFAIRHPQDHAAFERALAADLSAPPHGELDDEEARLRRQVVQDSVIGALRRLVDSHPDLGFLWGALAEKLLQSGNPELAASAQARLVELRPASATAHNTLGFLMTRLGKRREAIQCFDRAVALDGAAVTFRTNLAAAFLELGDLDQARVHLHRAMEADPRDNAAAALLAELNRREDELADARPRQGWLARLLGLLRHRPPGPDAER